jgi:hypothetical protein
MKYVLPGQNHQIDRETVSKYQPICEIYPGAMPSPYNIIFYLDAVCLVYEIYPAAMPTPYNIRFYLDAVCRLLSAVYDLSLSVCRLPVYDLSFKRSSDAAKREGQNNESISKSECPKCVRSFIPYVTTSIW